MRRSLNPLRMLVAAFALCLAAGCAEQTASSPPPQAASATEPKLAGAWYQVYFDTNQIDLNERGRMIVERVAYVAKNNSATRVTVIGRTDRVGAAAANMSLSQRRAQQVRDALVGAGVPAERIDTSWTGEAKQAVATSDDRAERHNRVVDITVVEEAR